MKLTLIGNGIMAQSLAIGLVKEHEVEMIGRELNKLKLIKEKKQNNFKMKQKKSLKMQKKRLKK